MNILDAIILIALIPAIIQGLRKGFISQAISIISVIAGIWASARFANMVTAWVSQYITASEQILKIIAFALILVIVFIILGVLGKLLEGVLKLVMLGWVNKLLGVVFSLFKAFLIIGLVIIAFNALNNSFGIIKPEVISDSVLYGPLKNLADAVFPYIKNMGTFNARMPSHYGGWDLQDEEETTWADMPPGMRPSKFSKLHDKRPQDLYNL